MNYLLWIRQNQWELVAAAYLVLLFTTHHTYTPNMFWFRDLTSNPLFRLAFLGLVIYNLYLLFMVGQSPRARTLTYLLVISYLLTEYHAWNRLHWEFFDNQQPMIFLKKTGQNLFLTYTTDGKLSLSEPHGDYGGQIWQMQVDGSNVILAPYSKDNSGDHSLSADLELVAGQGQPWTLELVDKSGLSKDTLTQDEDNVKGFTGSNEAPCQSGDSSYIKLKTADGKYLSTGDNFQPTVSTEDDNNVWLVYKCYAKSASDKSDQKSDAQTSVQTSEQKSDQKSDQKSESGPVVEGLDDENKECLKIEGYSNGKRDLNQSMLSHVLQQNDLNAYLNSHKDDTPIGKALKGQTDGLSHHNLRL